MRENFNKKEKIQRLLWCNRHCCLCEKECGIDIEFAHIIQDGGNDIDNAIVVCSNCHIKIGAYNKKHPKGTSYKTNELKAMREYIYDKYTRHLIAPIPFYITKYLDRANPKLGERKYPDVSFEIINTSSYLPLKLRVILSGYLNGEKVDLKLGKGHYTGHKIWNLNPSFKFHGHFENHNSNLLNLSQEKRIEIRTDLTVIDILGREHNLLPTSYIFDQNEPDWYFEP
jgi:hypothetical protein